VKDDAGDNAIGQANGTNQNLVPFNASVAKFLRI
jgi:hypothetical protein